MRLPENDFKNLIKNGILLSLDLVIKNENEEVLIGKRRNPPAKGFWFVPGGRIYKNETFSDALHRICEAEVGKLANNSPYKLLGMFNHIYEDNFFDDPDFNTHYLAIGIELNVKDITVKDSMNTQHDEFEFLSIFKILENNKVHDNTRFYFIDNPPNKFL